MSDPNDDPDRDDEALRALYHGGPDETPPAELDRRILEAAAAASRDRHRARWIRAAGGRPLAGLATAAVVLLAVAVLLRLPGTPSSSLDTSEAGQPAAPIQGVAPAARSASADRAADEPAAPAPTPAAGRFAVGRDMAQAARGAQAPAAADAAAKASAGATAEAAARAAEEIVVTSSALQSAAPASVPAGTGTTFTAPGCEEPFDLPDGAALSLADGGLVVTTGDVSVEVRCADGAWSVQRAGVDTRRDDQSSR